MLRTKRAKYLAISGLLLLTFLTSALVVYASSRTQQEDKDEKEEIEIDETAIKNEKIEQEWFANKALEVEQQEMEDFREKQRKIALEEALQEKKRQEEQARVEREEAEKQRQQEVAEQQEVEVAKQEEATKTKTETAEEPKEVEITTSEVAPPGQTFTVTSYAVGDNLTPGTVTANGTDVSNTIYSPEGYRIIAADTSVIPMNTVVTMTLNGQTFKAKVSDTGSAIVGNKVDLLVSSPSEALSNGVQQATISF